MIWVLPPLWTRLAASDYCPDVGKLTAPIFGEDGRSRDENFNLGKFQSVWLKFKTGSLTSRNVSSQHDPRRYKTPPFMRQPRISHAPL